MNNTEIVARDPEVTNGALVFGGTRVPVEILVEHLEAGDTLDDFPTVTRKQTVAYLKMTLEAADLARSS